jgi:hypothetical protein
MSWWNTTNTWTYGDGEYEFSYVDGVSGDQPWDYASMWIDAYVRKFGRTPKRSEVMGAFEAMFKSADAGWCDEDAPIEDVDGHAGPWVQEHGYVSADVLTQT